MDQIRKKRVLHRSAYRQTPRAARGLGFLLRSALLLVALAGFAGVIQYFLSHLVQNPPDRVLELGSDDVDPETTLAARALLRQNLLNPLLTFRLLIEARTKLSGPVLADAERLLRDEKFPPSVEALARGLEQGLEDGQVAAFTFWIQSVGKPETKEVDLRLNDVDLGHFALSAERSSVTLIGRRNEEYSLQITALGPGRTTLRAETATSVAETRSLRPGEHYTWFVTVRGAG